MIPLENECKENPWSSDQGFVEELGANGLESGSDVFVLPPRMWPFNGQHVHKFIIREPGSLYSSRISLRRVGQLTSLLDKLDQVIQIGAQDFTRVRIRDAMSPVRVDLD